MALWTSLIHCSGVCLILCIRTFSVLLIIDFKFQNIVVSKGSTCDLLL